MVLGSGDCDAAALPREGRPVELDATLCFGAITKLQWCQLLRLKFCNCES